MLSMAAILVSGRESPVVQADSTFAVYLQPASVAAETRLDISDRSDVLEERDFLIVEDVDTFFEAITSRNPQSLWIHADAIDLVPDALLQQYLKEGRVIVGIDMASRVMTEKLKVENSSSPDWNPDGMTTFVIVGQALDVSYTNELGSASTRSSFTFANDYFDPRSPDRLLFLVDEVISYVHDAYGG